MGRLTFIVLLILASSQTSYGCGGGVPSCGPVTRQFFRVSHNPVAQVRAQWVQNGVPAQPTYYTYPAQEQQPTYYTYPTQVQQPTYYTRPAAPPYAIRTQTQPYRPTLITFANRSPNPIASRATTNRSPQQLPFIKKLLGFNWLFGNGRILLYWGSDNKPHFIALDKETGRAKAFSYSEGQWVAMPDHGNALDLQRELAVYYSIPAVQNRIFNPKTGEGDEELLALVQENLKYWNKNFQHNRKDYPDLKPITQEEIARAARRFTGLLSDDQGIQPRDYAHAGTTRTPTPRAGTRRPTTGTGIRRNTPSDLVKALRTRHT